MTTSKTKTFTMTSPFSNDFEKKWDNLLIFKNGLVDELCVSNIIDYLNKPKDHSGDVVPNNFSFASEVRKSVQRSKTFTVAIKYLKSTEEEESAFKFDFQKKINIDNVNKESRKANNSLIIKVNPEFKSVVTLENTDSLFISENFSSIDYSKTIFESPNFNSAYESISDSYTEEKIKESEGLKKYNNTILKLYKEFYDKNNNSEFSNTIGFSIKALKIKDLFALATLNTVTEIFNFDYVASRFEDFPKLLSSLIYNFKISDITEKGTNFSEYNFIELNKIFSTNSDFFKKAFKVKKGINLEDFNETLNFLSVSAVFDDKFAKEIRKKYFKLEYFSLFDKSENTFLKKNYLKTYRLNALNNKSGNVNVTMSEKNDDIFYEVNSLPLNVIKNNININKKNIFLKGIIFEKKINEKLFFNEKYQIENRNRKIKSYINVLNYKLVDAIKSVSYESDEYIVIGVEYIKITKFYNILTFNNKFLESHIFDPVICFETINGHSRVLEEDLRASSKTDLTIDYFVEGSLLENYIKQYNLDTTEKIGELHKKFYKINVKNATALLETQDFKNISLLDRKYNKQFFYVITNDDSSFETKKVKGFIQNSSEEKEEVYYNELSEIDKNKTPLIFLELNEENNKSIEEKKVVNLQKFSNENLGSEESKRNNDRKPNSKNRTNVSSSAEKILKITGEISVDESKTQKEKDNTKTKPESSRKSAIELNELKNEVKNEGLITDWEALNQISDENTKGKQRKPQNKNVSIICGFDPYGSRRGNLQPKLLKLIENAFVLTSKKYSDLTGVEIYSTSSLPLDKWLNLVEIVNTKSKNKDDLVRALNDEGYKHINKNMSMIVIQKNIKNLIQRIEGVRDSNHGMGFAADIRLKRGNNLVCLYSPHDDKDFEIAQFFIKTCFDLGANSVGAGMYYMDAPKYKKYYGYKGLEGEPSVVKNLNYNGRVVVDDNFVPIRKKGKKYNGIHVDIVYNNRQFFKDFNPDGNDNTPKEKSRLRYAIGKNYKEIIKIFTNKFDRRFGEIEGSKKDKLFVDVDINNSEYTEFMKKVKQKDRKESSKLVWGSTSYRNSSDKWLLDAANISVSSQKSLSTEATELTKQKIEENKLEARQFIYKEFIKDKNKGTKHQDFKDIGTDFNEHSLKSNGYDKYFVKLSTLLKESKKK